jgi:hypothetical protein
MFGKSAADTIINYNYIIQINIINYWPYNIEPLHYITILFLQKAKKKIGAWKCLVDHCWLLNNEIHVAGSASFNKTDTSRSGP